MRRKTCSTYCWKCQTLFAQLKSETTGIVLMIPNSIALLSVQQISLFVCWPVSTDVRLSCGSQYFLHGSLLLLEHSLCFLSVRRTARAAHAPVLMFCDVRHHSSHTNKTTRQSYRTKKRVFYFKGSSRASGGMSKNVSVDSFATNPEYYYLLTNQSSEFQGRFPIHCTKIEESPKTFLQRSIFHRHHKFLKFRISTKKSGVRVHRHIHPNFFTQTSNGEGRTSFRHFHRWLQER